MGLSIANILLQVTGESDGARRELAQVASDLALFGRETAEATADLDTTPAKANLDELKARLADFSAEDVSAQANIQIAKAMVDIAALQAELDRIDGEKVTVDVDVKRGIVEKLGALDRQISAIGKSTEEVAAGGLSGFVSKIGEAFSGTSILSSSLTKVAVAAPFVIAAIVAIVGQLAAIIASAASAAAGIGALAIAFGAVLLPAIALGVGAVANFKEESETAGTAAHDLKESFGEIASSFKNATKGGSNALFSGLSDALKNIGPLIKGLGPSFTKLGKAGGDALRTLGKEFSSPVWGKFFKFATDSLTKLTPLFARSFGAFFKILRNIATAAMPFLVKGFQALAKGIESIADKTSNIKDLRNTIGSMVDSLRAWGKLLGGIVDLAGAFVKAFAPFGDKIVESLGEGAHNLADWLRSSEGLHKIKQFFEDTGPLASELAKLVLNISLALIQLGQFVAPALTPVIKGFNHLFEVLNSVLSFLNNNVSNAVREFPGKVAGALLEGVPGAKDAAVKVANAIASGFSSAAGAVKDAAVAVAKFAIEAIKDRIATARNIGEAIINALKGGFNAARSAVIAVARAIVTAVIDAIKSRVENARNTGEAIFNALRGGFNAARAAVVGGARAIVTAVLDVVRGAIDLARNIGSSIVEALKGGINAARSEVMGAINDLRSAALDLLRAGIQAAQAAGEFLIQALARGIKSAADSVINAVKSVYDTIKEIIEAPLHIHIEVPSVSIPTPHFAGGVRGRPDSGLALVGEMGPELSFIPQGADVFTAGETRRILRALAAGVARPFAGSPGIPAVAAGGAGGGININVTPIAGGGSPDPEILAAQLGAKLRAKGAQ